MKGLVFFLCIIVLLVLAVAVGSQNDAVISVNYLIAKTEMTIASLIAIAVGLGVVVGVLAVLSSW
ncbi:lipopolysaccharide assembly protein LapA domain-containing protein, partial [Opacimonas viscosa]